MARAGEQREYHQRDDARVETGGAGQTGHLRIADVQAESISAASVTPAMASRGTSARLIPRNPRTARPADLERVVMV